MDIPEKLATKGTQDEDKHNKNTTQYFGHHYAQTNTNNLKKDMNCLKEILLCWKDLDEVLI